MKIHVSDSLYELLPVVYMVSGFLALFYFSYFTAAISGLLLIGAGLLVFAWRGNAKAAQRRRQKLIERRRKRLKRSRDQDSSTQLR